MAPVARDIRCQFVPPECLVARRGSGKSATRVLMPKASVNKYHRLVPRENQIRPAGQLPAMKAETQALPVQKGTDSALRQRVLPLDARHHPTADGAAYDVYHFRQRR